MARDWIPNPEGRAPIREARKLRKTFTLSPALIAALELELEDRIPETPSLSELVETLLREHPDISGWMNQT